MKHGLTVFNGGVLAALVVGTAAVISCAQAPQNPAAAPAAVATSASDNGRFQIVVKPEAQNTSILFLVDTRTGDSWIYRPPQPPTFNGYWSDIPRMTYPPQVWQQAFQILFTPPTNAPAPGAAGGATGGAARPTP
jgi:hypothetical protein